jgi:hypothetical protein
MIRDVSEVSGVEWCRVHLGIVDECSDRQTSEGAPCCDMYTDSAGCEFVTLYIEVRT